METPSDYLAKTSRHHFTCELWKIGSVARKYCSLEELWLSTFSVCYAEEVRSGDVFAIVVHSFTHQTVSVYRIPDILPGTKTQLWLSKLYSSYTVIL